LGRLLQILAPPFAYASLNELADRLMVAKDEMPVDAESSKPLNMTALRIEKLLSLGDILGAWKLATSVAPSMMDDITLQEVVANALVSPLATDACSKIPAFMQTHTSSDWQKLMLVCQLQAKDLKAAQVTLDLLHTQDIHDDTFFALAEKNIIAGNRQLPRQLTPLKATNLALIRLTALPVRKEVYPHAEPALVRELLKAPTEDDVGRLSLAERSAAHGLLTADELAETYRGQSFPPDAISGAQNSGEQGPTLRALLYQAALVDKSAQNRVNLTLRFMGSLDATTSTGNILPLLATMLGDQQPSAATVNTSAMIAKAYILAGKGVNAATWLEAARSAAPVTKSVSEDLRNMWPLIAVNGLDTDKDSAAHMNAWLDSVLQTSQEDSALRARKSEVSNILIILDAQGVAIAPNVWAKVLDAGYEKVFSPPPILMERLHDSVVSGNRGEMALLVCLTLAANNDDPAAYPAAQSIRALKRVGLNNDASNLAKEAIEHELVELK
jgi:hypothetical protein